MSVIPTDPILPDEQIRHELYGAGKRPAVGLLSVAERQRMIDSAMYALLRWYTVKSQEARSWNPYTSFPWAKQPPKLNESLTTIVQGFFAVEQYVPDFVAPVLTRLRSSHSRSHFQIRWGAEEERHAELWRAVLLFSSERTSDFLEDYMQTLRARQWDPPEEDPTEMLMYVVFQERATQVNYLNLALRAAEMMEADPDSGRTLLDACRVIARDEAAHYYFFLECARLHFYYFPEESLEALIKVLSRFNMPAHDIIPDYEPFLKELHAQEIFNPRLYASDVVSLCMRVLGLSRTPALIDGIRRLRKVPDHQGRIVDSAIFEAIDFGSIEAKVKQLYEKLRKFNLETGWHTVEPLLGPA